MCLSGEALRLLYSAAEIVEYRAAGAAQGRHLRGLGFMKTLNPQSRYALVIEEADAAAALQEYLQLEVPQPASAQVKP